MTTEPLAPAPAAALPPDRAAEFRPPEDPAAGHPAPEHPAAFPAPAAARVRAPRRPRPVLLLVSGLVLGTVAGGAVGYGIQARRPPTPLPPIQVALPSYPAEVVDPAAVAAAAPAPLAIDGDLRKLLLTAPAGSSAWDDYPGTPSWISIGELAERSGPSAGAFRDLAERGFRRAVEVDWKQGDLKVRVSLIQFSDDFVAQAGNRVRGYRLEPFAAEANGGYRVEKEPFFWAETTEKFYQGTAAAQRGTVAMEVKVFGLRPVDAELVKNLAKQQWERLV
ncbi:hypothetical protein ACFWOG_38115 [Kitasatospora sp. NPDC058406]|uniref:hypothetical protein n=1 Tax=Kitasatospora sp. NPDC058406 TaxID=3346483 RepID=UPI003649C3A1